MLAFSIETTTVTVKSNCCLQVAQYISWAFLLIAFLSGFFRIYHLHKLYSKENVGYANKYYNREKDPIERGFKFTKFVAKDRFGGIVYGIMMISFILGILFYVIYKIISFIFEFYNQYFLC